MGKKSKRRIKELEQEIAELREQVEELEARPNWNYHPVTRPYPNPSIWEPTKTSPFTIPYKTTITMFQGRIQ